MADRFFWESPPDQPIIGDEITLKDDQAHHIAGVMRAKSGDTVVLFDDRGNEFETQIQVTGKKSITTQITAISRPERKLAHQVTIAAALPKGDRQKFLIEKMVELGVANFIPLQTERSVAQTNAKVLRRLEKQVIEATKQCRRSYLMRIESDQTVQQIAAPSDITPPNRFIAHPYTESRIPAAHEIIAQSASHDCLWLIGPEGGFTDQEVESAVTTGFTPISFGDIILRAETAAILAASSCGLGRCDAG